MRHREHLLVCAGDVPFVASQWDVTQQEGHCPECRARVVRSVMFSVGDPLPMAPSFGPGGQGSDGNRWVSYRGGRGRR